MSVAICFRMSRVRYFLGFEIIHLYLLAIVRVSSVNTILSLNNLLTEHFDVDFL
jgi:hypothetical protein